MNILITGATGFIGRALIPRLLRAGHRTSAWVRDVAVARSRVGGDVALVDAGDPAALEAVMEEADAVVNLAGEPVALTRWTERKRRTLVASRVETTRRLVNAMARATRRPRVLVSGSAIGLYGDTGERDVDEASPRGPGFLADLCSEWEAAACRARDLGVRVVVPRIGIVLGPEGGALGAMLPAFRAGLGGPIAGGRQWMSWIHLDDMVELLATAVEDERWDGPVNAVAPNPVRNADFTTALGAVLRRPARIPVPAFALKVALGQSAEVVTTGQKVTPKAALAHGFAFRYPNLEGALADILGHDRTVRTSRAAPAGTEPPSADGEGASGAGTSERSAGRPPGARYRLSQEALLDAPMDEVFPFFARAENLGLITPMWTSFRILGGAPGSVQAGTQIDYQIRLSGLPMGWRTRIAVWEPPDGGAARFVDTMERGPYSLWWHEHRFEAVGARTRMIDTVHYSLPLGPLGWLAHALKVRGMLRRIFGYRFAAMRGRFGVTA